MVTTTRKGFRFEVIQRRSVRSLTVGKVIDDYVIDEVPHAERNRYMNEPEDVRIELVMRGALAMYQEKGVDLLELFSRPELRKRQPCAAIAAFTCTRGGALTLCARTP